jgi:hypothetical protein
LHRPLQHTWQHKVVELILLQRGNGQDVAAMLGCVLRPQLLAVHAAGAEALVLGAVLSRLGLLLGELERRRRLGAVGVVGRRPDAAGGGCRRLLLLLLQCGRALLILFSRKAAAEAGHAGACARWWLRVGEPPISCCLLQPAG